VTEPTKTFDFGDSEVADSTFEDVDSTADKLLEAKGGSKRTRFQRISHGRSRADWWSIAGTLIGLVALLSWLIFDHLL
jgi:hypothetical protein